MSHLCAIANYRSMWAQNEKGHSDGMSLVAYNAGFPNNKFRFHDGDRRVRCRFCVQTNK